MLGFSYCDILSDTRWTQSSAPWPFSCSAFLTGAPLSFSTLWLSFFSVNVTAYHPSHFITGLAYWLKPQAQWMTLCLHIARHLTWPSTISGKLSEYDINLTTKQQGSPAQHKIETQQQRIVKLSKPAGDRINHTHKDRGRIRFLACLWDNK